MRVEHRYFTAGELRLHALGYGGVGRPIICLHGVTGHAAMWRDIAAPLTLWGAVLGLDLRGHGDSQWSATGDYSTNHLVDDLWQVVQQLGSQPVDLIGSSWGGLVGLRLAVGARDAVRRLVMLDSPVEFTQAPEDVPDRPYAFSSHAEVVSWERKATPSAAAALVEHLAASSTRPAEGGRLVRKHDPFFLRVWPFRAEQYLAELQTVAVPTLLVRGSESPVLSAEHFAAMGEAVPGARREVIEGAGHLIHLDRPIELGDLLADFLSEESEV